MAPVSMGRAFPRSRLLPGALCVLATGVALALRGPAADEKAIRQTAFRYYSGTVLGDADGCVASTRFPLSVIRNGTLSQRDEQAQRALVAAVAERSGVRKLPEGERRSIVGRMITIFDQASLQFVGGDTAALVFVVRPGAAKTEGDVLAQLLLHRSGGQWRVIQEVTDSKPAPPEPEDPSADKPTSLTNE